MKVSEFQAAHDPERNAALYVSGELPSRVKRWFESHLLDCEDCWREVLFGRTGRRLAQDDRVLAPAELMDRVRASVAAVGSDEVRRRGIFGGIADRFRRPR
jgi:hypothetical protein